MLTPQLALGIVQSGIDPAVAKSHALSGAVAARLITFHYFEDVGHPTKAPTLDVLSSYLARNAPAKKPDIWAERDVSLAGRAGLSPVVVGIWDGGSDTSLIPNQLYTDPHPTTFDARGLRSTSMQCRRNDYKAIPNAPTDARVARWNSDIVTYVSYFKVHHESASRPCRQRELPRDAGNYERDLEANGIGKDAAARTAIVQRWYSLDEKAMYDAIASAPEILSTLRRRSRGTWPRRIDGRRIC